MSVAEEVRNDVVGEFRYLKIPYDKDAVDVITELLLEGVYDRFSFPYAVEKMVDELL